MNTTVALGLSGVLLCALAFSPTWAADETPTHATPCVAGTAAGFPCSNVDFESRLSLTQLGATSGSDIWGWTDPANGREYAIFGVNNGTVFVDITDASHPVYLGKLPTASVNSIWREIKVYANHALIVSEASGHGMQVFDLTRLRNVSAPPATFTANARYLGTARVHNVVVNEASGYAYLVGSREGTNTCGSGLHMVDMRNPVAPVFAGCYAGDGYTHDAQCVNYAGPDTRYTNHEICLASNEDTLTIVDVTNKAAPVQLSRTGYTGSGYVHQGWLTEDSRYFVLDDELDEQNNGHNTRTYVFDLSSLTAPVMHFVHTGTLAATDHNQFVRGQYTYQANYAAGLRILGLSQIAARQLSEVAYFDTYPTDNAAAFNGAWGAFPYFASGNVAIGDMDGGLFVVHPNLCTAPQAPSALNASAAGDGRIDLSWTASATPDVRYEVFRALDSCGSANEERIASNLTTTNFSDTTASGLVNYHYRVRATDSAALCRSAYTPCAGASTSGACTAPPQFDGLTGIASPSAAQCVVDLNWSAATPRCGSATSYSVYRASDPYFAPSASNRIAQGLTTPGFSDTELSSPQTQTYVVRARDTTNGNEESNLIRLSVVPQGLIADATWRAGAEFGDPALSGGGVLRTPAHLAWDIATGVAHDGQRSYHSGYHDGECVALNAPALTLSTGQVSQLRFWGRHDIDNGRDGGRLEISADNGQSWQLLTPQGGYGGSFAQAGNACGFAVGSAAYTGTDTTWRERVVDLSAYAGQSIRLRWVFATDGNVSANEGWWIDQLSISHAQVPGTCIPTADSVFANGYE